VSNTSLVPQPEHSIRPAACQSKSVGNGAAAADGAGGTVDWRLVRRYGKTVLANGYTACPNLLFQHYARLGISEAELVFLLQLWTYWWDTTLPHPSLPTIAERMEKSVRQLQTYAERLHARGLLGVTQRHDSLGRQLTNSYDLSPLLRALEGFSTTSPSAHRTSDVGVRGPIVVPVAHPRDAVTRGSNAVDSAAVSQPDARRINQPRRGTAPVPYFAADPQPARTSSRPLMKTSPKENPRQPNIAFDSISPTPVQKMTDETDGAPRQSRRIGDPCDDLVHRIAPGISRTLGDEAPRSSVSRITRIFSQSSMSTEEAARQVAAAEKQTRKHLETVERVTTDGARNAMPYFLATLERSVKNAQTHERVRVRSRSSHAQTWPTSQPRELPEDLDPVWRSILQELEGIVSTTIFGRYLLGTRARWRDERTLEVQAPSQFDAQWLERSMRIRVEEALSEIGRGDVSIVFGLLDGDGSHGSSK
jgi:hypothetical protein